LAKSPIVLWGKEGGGKESDIKMVLLRLPISKIRDKARQQENWHLVAIESPEMVFPEITLQNRIFTVYWIYTIAIHSRIFILDLPTSIKSCEIYIIIIFFFFAGNGDVSSLFDC
jgi:hypothetical protein